LGRRWIRRDVLRRLGTDPEAGRLTAALDAPRAPRATVPWQGRGLPRHRRTEVDYQA
jgi:hypothetical protein